jgi:hypothetical protein
MKCKSVFFGTLLSLLFFSTNAFSTITYLNDYRSVSSYTDAWWGNESFTPSPKFSNFNNAFQNSSLTPTGFSASGHGLYENVWDPNMGYGYTREVNSNFYILFSTDEAVNLSLFGSLNLDSWSGGSSVLFNISKGNSVDWNSTIFYKRAEWICDDYTCENPPVSINEVLFLEAGTYAIYISQSLMSNDGTSGWYNVQGDFIPSVPVPVPAAAWLMGSGLIGLAGLSRPKK